MAQSPELPQLFQVRAGLLLEHMQRAIQFSDPNAIVQIPARCSAVQACQLLVEQVLQPLSMKLDVLQPRRTLLLSTLAPLPVEILTLIVMFLERPDVKRVLQVSLEMRVIARSDRVWQRLCENEWPKWSAEVAEEKSETFSLPSSVDGSTKFRWQPWYNLHHSRVCSEAQWFSDVPRTASVSLSLLRGVHCVLLTADELLCGSGFHNEVISWSTRTGQRRRGPEGLGFFGHRQAVTCLQTTNLSDHVLTGSLDFSAKVWDKATMTCVRTFSGHTDKVWCVERFGDHAITGSTDRSVRIWNIHSAMEITSLRDFRTSVSCVKSDGHLVICGSAGNTIRVWDLDAPVTTVTKLRGHAKGVFCLQFDQHKIISGSLDNRVILWDLRTLKMESTMCLDSDVDIANAAANAERDDRGVICLTYDDTKILCGGPDHLVKMLDIRKGGIVRTFSGHEHWVTTLQMDSRRLISGSRDKTLRMWNIVSGESSYPNFAAVPLGEGV